MIWRSHEPARVLGPTGPVGVKPCDHEWVPTSKYVWPGGMHTVECLRCKMVMLRSGPSPEDEPR